MTRHMRTKPILMLLGGVAILALIVYVGIIAYFMNDNPCCDWIAISE